MIHFSNNFISSKVHSQLIERMSCSGAKQHVLIPIRDKRHYGVNDPKNNNVELLYFKYPRFLKFFPIIKVLFLMCKSFPAFKACVAKEPGSAKCVAHNLWSDGLPVFFLSFFLKIRFILVVRNTDINVFLPKLFYYRWLVGLMVKRSSGLVFVSEAHRERFQRKWPKIYGGAKVIRVIPNGVNDFWHDYKVNHDFHRPLTACFVGSFNENKNLARLVKAAKLVQQDIAEFKLVLVGGDTSELVNVLAGYPIPSCVEVQGRVKSRTELAALLRGARVFAMPSLTETFGLSFIEALSQGCSLVCSQGEGIDGLFQSKYVRPVNPREIKEIANALKNMVEQYESGCPVSWVHEQLGRFDWSKVALEYQALLE